MRSAVVNFFAAIYRLLLSPFIHTLAGPGYGCRFEPTCGEYARQAVLTHGFLKGGFLATRRLARCQPWGPPGGHDPIPPAPDCGTRAALTSTCRCRP